MKSNWELSETLASAVQKCGGAVVRVQARRRTPSSGCVWSDGVIVTAHHAIERDEGIEVGLSDGKVVKAALIGRDPTTDLAALRIEATGLEQPDWAMAPQLKVGHLAMALARPGRTTRATLGMISALGEEWRTPSGGRVDLYLQADLSLPPGFSGGMLVDTAGRALGVNSSWLLPRHSLAIPAVTVQRVIEALLAEGSIRRGFLGVGAFPIRFPERLEQQIGQDSGLILVSLQPEGPAEKAGLLLGDILLSLDGESLTGIDDLVGLLDQKRIGTEVTLRLLRAGQPQERTVAVGARA